MRLTSVTNVLLINAEKCLPSILKIEETEDNEEEETDRRTEVDSNIEQCWKSVKETFNETAKNVLGFKNKKSKSWISAKSWEKIEEN